MAIKLDTPVAELTGVGKTYVERLGRLGIATVSDLIHYFPRRYDDLRAIKTIDELQKFGGLDTGALITVRATILGVEGRRARTGRALTKASIGNEKGFIEAIWFNQPYLTKQLKPGDEYIFSGKVKTGYGRPSLQSPSFEPVKAEQTHVARLVPVYPETNGVTSKWLRSKIKELLAAADQVEEELPEKLRRQYNLPPVAEALRQIHFPDDEEKAQAARRRFDFSQLLRMQLLTLKNRRDWQGSQTAPRVPYDPAVTKEFVSALPWPLTDDQRLAAHQVLGDLDAERPMLRLLQGDVGSGKTAVAAVAMHQTVQAGFQAALMAPTEVLARQHFATLQEWFAPPEIPVALVLGSQGAAEKKAALAAVAAGQAKIVVGTHALIQESVDWHSLALAIVDEQHRFGVAQREAIRTDHSPHLLTMTATPIPRSLALVAYGDQDLSVIQQVPSGRTPVATEMVLPESRPAAFARVREQLAAGRQAYLVYPVIADSAAGLKDATSEYERLRGGEFSDFRVGLLHGRLKSDEKTAVMEEFQRGELDVLVATTVIEVGVDVPNATVMVVEEAQQFGLAQLHQLRGRVGRGAAESFCFLLPGESTDEDNERLKAMTESNSGFRLAEIDLELRGPGDLIGTKQSGFDVSLQALQNPQLLEEARQAAESLLDEDPDLKGYPILQSFVRDQVLSS